MADGQYLCVVTVEDFRGRPARRLSAVAVESGRVAVLKKGEEELKAEYASAQTSAALAGSGTQGRLPKWLNASGTLGDSSVTESGGNVGVGTTAPATKLHILSGGGEALRFQTTGNSQTANSQIGFSPYGDSAGGALYLGPNFFLTAAGGISRYDTSSIGWGVRLRQPALG